MRLGTVRDGTRDGSLVVVGRDGVRFARAREIAPTLQVALDDWARCEPKLAAVATDLDLGRVPAESVASAVFAAPLPRAYEWVDGSAYINHIVLVRKARNAPLPETLTTDPLVYQGGSSVMLGATDPWVLPDEAWGLDFESELCVVLGDTPIGTRAADAAQHVRLLMLCNDVTYRNLIPAELAKGFGFFNAKPATTFAPFAVTPDELGDAWRGGRVHLRVETRYNGAVVGDTDAGPEMHFSFFDLVQHITKTRAFTAGTILGSGTVSNEERARGISCLAERRMIETLEAGGPKTPFMKVGDSVRIEVRDLAGRSVFGAIEQKVVAA